MTEATWLACNDPRPMLMYLSDRARERQLRLFACACWRCLCDLHKSNVGRRAIEVAEGYADDCSDEQALLVARQEVEQESGRADRSSKPRQRADSGATEKTGYDWLDEAWHESDWQNQMASAALIATTYHRSRLFYALASKDSADCQAVFDERAWFTPFSGFASLLREITGNPFWPVTFSPEWRTSTAVALATGMYESRDFSAMPILADALQDAGCDSDDILHHCRDANATHVRGCWVVDLVLGKE